MSGRVPLAPVNAESDPYVTLVDGVAGAGKTKDMLEVLEKELNRGLDPHRWRFVLFGRDAAASVANRVKDDGEQPIPAAAEVVEQAADSDTDVDRPFRTFNSLALAAAKDAGAIPHEAQIIVHNDACTCGADTASACECGDTQDGFADEYWYQDFFQKHCPGVSYSAKERDPLQVAADQDMTEPPRGNKLMAIYQYCQSQGWTIDDVVGDECGYKYHTSDEVPVEVSMHPSDVVEVLKKWDEYKQQHGLLEHNDYMVAAANEGAPMEAADVLFIDEFQDLSPLMYYLYQTWAESVDRVYLAGDGDQAIMGFRGSTDKYINSTRVDEYVSINQSYRCGQNILDLAGSVLGAEADSKMTQHPQSHSGDGVVRDEWLQQGSSAAFADLVTQQVNEHGEVMVLSRTVNGVGYLANALREEGIPYSGIHEDGTRLFRWDDPMGQMLDVARMFQHRERVPVEIVATALRQLPDEKLTDAGRRLASAVPGEAESVHGAAEVSFSTLLGAVMVRSASEMVEAYDVKGWERELLQDAVSANTRVRPGDVRIGTIHASKGMDAESVIVDCKYTYRLRDEFRRDEDTRAEEQRLYYVAITRAKEKLIALHGFRGGIECPLLADGANGAIDASSAGRLIAD